MKILKKLCNILFISISLFLGTGCASVSHFNKMAEEEEKTSGDILPHLALKSGNQVADLGAGGGYYTFKISKVIGDAGKVYAVDIDMESIAFINERILKDKVKNVYTIKADMNNSHLPAQSVDMVFIRNAYHHIQNRVEYFTLLRSALKPKGRVVIIDYSDEKLGFFRKMFGHSIAERVLLEEMAKAGYSKERSHTFLKQQSFNEFTVK